LGSRVEFVWRRVRRGKGRGERRLTDVHAGIGIAVTLRAEGGREAVAAVGVWTCLLDDAHGGEVFEEAGLTLTLLA
jgi:hypothetical protein